MAKRRRTLLDLYTNGRDLVFDDEQDPDDPDPAPPVTVWVQKLSPLEHEAATKKASAARARARAALVDESSDDSLAIHDEIADLEHDALVGYLSAEKEAMARLSIESELELGEDSEWGKDGYARGLVDAWAERLEERYLEDPDDPEVRHVLAEVERFNKEVDKRAAPRMADIRKGFDDLPDDQLRQMVVEKVLESRLTSVWIDEYDACRLWFGVRQPDDHAKRYFAERSDIDHLFPEVRHRLLAALEAISVSPSMGKGSPANRSSSRRAATLAAAARQFSLDGAEDSTASPTS